MACDGYRRDQDVFGGVVTIEDDMALIVEYASGATVTYHLTCYSPWEGLRVAFNGTRGRLEYEVAENTCVAGAAADPNLPHRPAAPRAAEAVRIAVHPHFEASTEHAVDGSEAGHGGGDARMLRDLFLPSGDGTTDPLGRAAELRAVDLRLRRKERLKEFARTSSGGLGSRASSGAAPSRSASLSRANCTHSDAASHGGGWCALARLTCRAPLGRARRTHRGFCRRRAPSGRR